MSESEVPVFDAMDAVEALLYRSLLEEAGIDVEEKLFEPDWFEGVRQDYLHSQLLVHAADVAQARELIAAFHEEAQRGELLTEDANEADTGEHNSSK